MRNIIKQVVSLLTVMIFLATASLSSTASAGIAYQLTSLVGDTLPFTVSGSGAGYDESDFSTRFTNLDETTLPPSSSEVDGAVINVNEWGSGFQVQYEGEIPSTITTVDSFEIDIDLAGAGTIGDTWMQGYSGGDQTGNVVSDGSYGIYHRCLVGIL